uniref:Uncharacterized protein n=1 Tax=Anguilla anguilla TaxID=7936 RepID=A0A0E9WDD0_ANGAN
MRDERPRILFTPNLFSLDFFFSIPEIFTLSVFIFPSRFHFLSLFI